MATSQADEIRAESLRVFHKLGLWGQANAIKQNHGLTAAIVQKQLGGGDTSQVGALMDLVPFGGSVNITNIGTQPSEAGQPYPQSPSPPGTVEPVRPPVQISSPTSGEPATPATQPNSTFKTAGIALAAALVGGSLVGIPAYLLSGGTPAPAKNPAINGELELEIPFNVERRSKRTTSTDTSTDTSTSK
jgi:hypothetical protein